MSFMSSFLHGRFLHPGVFSLCVLLPLLASATTSHISFSYAARQRMQNRARLLKQYQTHLKKQASYIVEGNAKSRRALRQHNREQIKQHPEWFPAPLKANDRRWQALAENNHFLSSNHLHNITEVAIHRLEQQLGKPYVWGGTRPDKGFDCSGLVFYASVSSLKVTGTYPSSVFIFITAAPLVRLNIFALGHRRRANRNEAAFIRLAKPIPR